MKRKRQFPPGEIQRLSLGAFSILAETHQSPARFILRHVCGDFGAVSAEEYQANAGAIRTGSGPIISKFTAANGEAIWVITEGRVTEIVTPEEYLGGS